MGSINKLKQLVVEQLLRDEAYILLVINPNVDGVALPSGLMEARQPVPIHLGLNMNVPVPDLEIDEEGIRGTLSFSRTPFYCTFPWNSLLQISVGEEHLVWVGPGRGSESEEQSEPEEQSETKEKPHLRLV